jgi:hypothetical protein
MEQGQERKTAIKLDIKGFFDNISHDFLCSIRVPPSFRSLTNSWIKHKIWVSHQKPLVESKSGIAQGSLIGPLLCNLALTGLKEAAYDGLPKKCLRISSTKTLSVNNYWVAFGDDIVLIFNVGDAPSILENVKLFLKKLGLELAKEKTMSFTFRDGPFNFIFLGFKLNFVPVDDLKQGTLLTRGDSLSTKRSNKQLGSVLVSISPGTLKRHKRKLKSLIRGSYNLSVPQLTDLLNPIIVGFTNYFCHGQSYRQLT